MILRGLSDTEDLARAWGLPRDRVAHLVSHPEDMLAAEMVAFRDRLGIRGGWLLTGKGAMLPVTAKPGAIEAMMLFDAIPPAKVRFWFGMGRRLAKK